LADSLFTHKLKKNLSQNSENLTSPRKIVGDLRMGIPKTVQKISDMKSIDFARPYHYISVSLQKDCKKYKRQDYKSEELAVKHKINFDKNGK
jgi:hypothetical protein